MIQGSVHVFEKADDRLRLAHLAIWYSNNKPTMLKGLSTITEFETRVMCEGQKAHEYVILAALDAHSLCTIEHWNLRCC